MMLVQKPVPLDTSGNEIKAKSSTDPATVIKLNSDTVFDLNFDKNVKPKPRPGNKKPRKSKEDKPRPSPTKKGGAGPASAAAAGGSTSSSESSRKAPGGKTRTPSKRKSSNDPKSPKSPGSKRGKLEQAANLPGQTRIMFQPISPGVTITNPTPVDHIRNLSDFPSIKTEAKRSAGATKSEPDQAPEPQPSTSKPMKRDSTQSDSSGESKLKSDSSSEPEVVTVTSGTSSSPEVVELPSYQKALADKALADKEIELSAQEQLTAAMAAVSASMRVEPEPIKPSHISNDPEQQQPLVGQPPQSAPLSTADTVQPASARQDPNETIPLPEINEATIRKFQLQWHKAALDYSNMKKMGRTKEAEQHKAHALGLKLQMETMLGINMSSSSSSQSSGSSMEVEHGNADTPARVSSNQSPNFKAIGFDDVEDMDVAQAGDTPYVHHYGTTFEKNVRRSSRFIQTARANSSPLQTPQYKPSPPQYVPDFSLPGRPNDFPMDFPFLPAVSLLPSPNQLAGFGSQPGSPVTTGVNPATVARRRTNPADNTAPGGAVAASMEDTFPAVQGEEEGGQGGQEAGGGAKH